MLQAPKRIEYLFAAATLLVACGSAAKTSTTGQNASAVTGTGADADAAPPPRRPPPEAFAACANKSEGDTCSVSLGGRTMKGTCHSGPDGKGALACAPDRPPPGPPPPEAIDACKGKSEGDTCSVTLRDRTLDGTCRKGPDGQGALVCMPDAPPPGPPPRR